MMCFVEYRSAGFWCKAEMLRDWIAEAVAAAKKIPNPPAWLAPAAAYWEAIRSSARYGRTDLRFDTHVTTPERRTECERFLEALAARGLDYGADLINTAALALVRGERDGQPAEILD
ncbi:MAG: hypothetical protein KF873_21245 [Gemmataceae bacterium]|nr:hypothetical protein [Planctomycetia bacterium]MBX3401268.1 hypothetical protein [Gemmataceae bacterium]